MRLPNFIVLAYLEVPEVAKPRPTDKPTKFPIAISHLVNSKCHKKKSHLAKSENINSCSLSVFFSFELHTRYITINSALPINEVLQIHIISFFRFISIQSLINNFQ